MEMDEVWVARTRAIATAPSVRGGNGTGMTPCEKLLSAHLPTGYIWNYAIKLGGRHPGYPTCYKVDFGNPKTKHAIEVDGGSHGSKERRLQDRKKEAKLRELGWSVSRITNREVLRKYGTSR
jgi:very-short-patch-repair endonuclease